MLSHVPPIGSAKSTMHGGLSTVVWILMRSPGSTLKLSLPKSLILMLLPSLTSVNSTPALSPGETVHKRLTAANNPLKHFFQNSNGHVQRQGLLDFHNTYY